MSAFRDYIKIKEASALLGVTTTTLRNWDRRGKLIAMRHPINGYRIYRRSDLEALLDNLRNQESGLKKT